MNTWTSARAGDLRMDYLTTAGAVLRHTRCTLTALVRTPQLVRLNLAPQVCWVEWFSSTPGGEHAPCTSIQLGVRVHEAAVREAAERGEDLATTVHRNRWAADLLISRVLDAVEEMPTPAELAVLPADVYLEACSRVDGQPERLLAYPVACAVAEQVLTALWPVWLDVVEQSRATAELI